MLQHQSKKKKARYKKQCFDQKKTDINELASKQTRNTKANTMMANSTIMLMQGVEPLTTRVTILLAAAFFLGMNHAI